MKLLRSVYGKQFVQISIHAPEEYRIKGIESKELHSWRGLGSEVDARNGAYALVKQDEMESKEGFGQNVRDAFPLADVVIDASDRESCKANLERFIRALFGDNKASPTHDEYGMYMAKSASLRSSAPVRQVGASIFRATGNIVSLGCNEVPKSGGGTYWTGDKATRAMSSKAVIRMTERRENWPYPKSYAAELHPDSIEIDGDGTSGKVGFQRFIGISPYRYRDLFEKGKRKYATGKIQDWNLGEMRPMIAVLYPSYFEGETFVVELLKDRIAQLTNLPSGDDTAHVLG